MSKRRIAFAISGFFFRNKSEFLLIDFIILERLIFFFIIPHNDGACSSFLYLYVSVSTRGFEPPSLAAYASEAYAYTSSATCSSEERRESLLSWRPNDEHARFTLQCSCMKHTIYDNIVPTRD